MGPAKVRILKVTTLVINQKLIDDRIDFLKLQLHKVSSFCLCSECQKAHKRIEELIFVKENATILKTDGLKVESVP